MANEVIDPNKTATNTPADVAPGTVGAEVETLEEQDPEVTNVAAAAEAVLVPEHVKEKLNIDTSHEGQAVAEMEESLGDLGVSVTGGADHPVQPSINHPATVTTNAIETEPELDIQDPKTEALKLIKD